MDGNHSTLGETGCLGNLSPPVEVENDQKERDENGTGGTKKKRRGKTAGPSARSFFSRHCLH